MASASSVGHSGHCHAGVSPQQSIDGFGYKAIVLDEKDGDHDVGFLV
jgi:hypothetical protein